MSGEAKLGRLFKSALGHYLERQRAKPGRITRTAYDDYVQSSTEVARAVSYPSLGALLGFYDQLAVEVITDQASAGVGPLSLQVHLAHSGDGFVWALKQPAPLTHADTLSLTGRTYLDIGFDDGAAPSMGVVRLELTLQAVAGPVRARVRVNVTANNLSEREFSVAVRKAQGQEPAVDAYDRCYPSGSRIHPAKVKHLLGYWSYTHKLHLDFENVAVIVPPGQMVCFNASDDYILVERGKVVWSSRAYWEQMYLKPHSGPKRTAEDPKPDAKLEYDD
ncbi:uncharacterized protein SOCE26_093610 [Sorangium cellulosum]|uniref:Uncharacterized protein n=1 Tax=Sorangium cellulosum TaxID=56 RepID=A0A2L0F8C8_SORCE|nr:hypothetical protein [Sorangium cellulosum]AUX47836.1 uncharacterized protein SOCE26_093610 [Sorangium cellulosum]